MEAFIVFFFVFGGVTAWVLGPKYLKFRHEERMRRLESGETSQESVKLLEQERDELEERLQHLEEIVCSVDYELNAKLNKIASQQLRLPSPAPEVLADGGSARETDSTEFADTAPLSQAFFRGELHSGQTINERFVIERRLGEGGLGTVYLAQDQKLDESVALKVLRELTLEQNPNARERFRREVLAARRISHPNVVRLHDLYEADGVDFVAMEYVEGESLRDLLDRQSHLSLGRIVELGSVALDAIGACHDAGIIHRDIKPDNLMVDRNDTLKLIDFGIAKFGPADQRLTATQMIMGTPAYMAPEQLRGQPVDLRCDLYAFNVLLYELITGRRPFEAATPIRMAYAHCHLAAERPSSYRDELPEGWDEFIQRGLEKEPRDRFGSAGQMRKALEALAV